MNGKETPLVRLVTLYKIPEFIFTSNDGISSSENTEKSCNLTN